MAGNPFLSGVSKYSIAKLILTLLVLVTVRDHEESVYVVA